MLARFHVVIILTALCSVKTFFTVPHMDTEPVGLAEIAQRLNVERGTVDQWRARKLLPEPRWTVGGRPAWDWSDIAAWAKETGRS